MVVKDFYGTREDGVNLFKRLDVVVDENGNPIKDENDNYIPSELKIRKVGTDEVYDEAIDVENAPFVYEETDIPIEENDK